MDRKKLLHTVNVPKHILNQVAGKSHPLWSRLLFGFLIMIASTMIAESFVFMAAIRELVHAVGAIPYIEWLVNNVDESEQEKILK